jgi:hypothetical protein
VADCTGVAYDSGQWRTVLGSVVECTGVAPFVVIFANCYCKFCAIIFRL